MPNIDPQRSIASNIDFLLFNPNGPLYDEYTHLFPSMFKHADNYIKIANALSEHQYGMTRNEIIKQTGNKSGEGITRILTNLEKCGFIRQYRPLGTKEKNYQLIDFYTLFYHHFLNDRQKAGTDFWTSIQRTPAFYQWAGARFELLAIQHCEQIKRFLRIGGVSTSIYSLRTTTGEHGAQIDAVLHRADNTANLCEMKFTEGTYTITKTEDLLLRNRLQSLRQLLPKKTSIQLTLITTFGLQSNQYSNQVNQVITLDDLFN